MNLSNTAAANVGYVANADFNTAVNNAGNWQTFTNGFTNYYPYTWPSYSWCSHYDNKTEKAYQVIRVLMKAKVLEIKTLNQFFEAMDKVVEVL